MEEKEYFKTKDFKKFKLIYCGELLLFAVVFTVLGLLFLFNVIAIKPWKYWVFPILTLCGGVWFVIDLVWMMNSKKRQEKNSWIDKILPIPSSLAVIGFDIYFLCNNARIGDASYERFFRYVISFVLIYYALVYFFEGFYHYFKPSKALTFAFEEALKQEQEEAAKESKKEIDPEFEVDESDYEIKDNNADENNENK